MSEVDWSKWWNAFKSKAIQLIGGLIMEKNDDGMYVLSTGKMAFWLVLGPAMYIWTSGHGLLENGVSVKDIAPNHMNLLLALLTYNIGKKGLNVANNMWGKDAVVASNVEEECSKPKGDGPG